jgi:diaminopimelate epimerase
MGLHFTKMHGLGNDFMVIDGIHQTVTLSPHQIAQLANRHTGIGFDQCLLIEASQQKGIDFNYRIFNADGNEVGQCGNGARCLALFARYYGLTDKKQIQIATQTTRMSLYIHEDNLVSVSMGMPKLQPCDIPVNMLNQQSVYTLPISPEEKVSFHAINVGNPHAVILVEDLQSAPVTRLGKYLSQHPAFPEQTNVGFMQIINPETIHLRVYERGSEETLACGSGAVAAAAVGRLYHGLAEKINVQLPGGIVTVSWPDPQHELVLTGPAEFVYEGTLLGS